MKWFIALFFMSNLFANNLAENLTSIKLDFTQQVFGDSTLPIAYKGTLLARSDNKIKWVYTTPIKKEIYVNDDMIWIYEVDLFQATALKTKDNLNFIEILKNAKQINKNLYVSKIDDVEYKLNVDAKANPVKLEFSDELGNTTIFEFSNISRNQKMNDSIFKFIPAKNIEIISHGN